MAFDYKYVINPSGQIDNHVLREMFEDIKLYINDDLATDLASSFVDLTNDQTGIAGDKQFTGTITKTGQPSFLATAPANTTNVTGDGTTYTVEYDTEVFDTDSNFNTSTYTFTAPVTGKYGFNVSVQWQGASAVSFLNIDIVTSNRSYRTSNGARSNVDGVPVQIFQADMDANDTCYITLTLSGGTKTAKITDDANYNYFSGTLIN